MLSITTKHHLPILTKVDNDGLRPHTIDSDCKETVTISSPGDKRRNKLGYQRTSMACGHCRRRKIRCIPPTTEDPQGRCANCIRLKKECIFFPVDHQPDVRSGRREVGSISASSASSPQTPLSAGQIPTIDPQAHSPYDHSAPIPVPGANPSLSPSYVQDTMPPEPSPLHSRFEYGQTENRPHWHAPDFAGQTQLHSPYWTSAASTPNRPTFPQHISGHEPSMNNHLAGEHASLGHGITQWSNRSASFSQFGEQPQHYAYAETHPSPGLQPSGVQYHISGPRNSIIGTALSPDPALLHPQQLSPPSHVLPSNVPYHESWPHQTAPDIAEGQQWYGNAAHTGLPTSQAGSHPYTNTNIQPSYYANTSHP